MSTTPNAVKRPAHKIRVGRITVTIWKNDTQHGPMHNATFVRSYQDETNAWRDVQSFGPSDLLVVAKLALDAHTWITQQSQSNGSSGNGGNNAERARSSSRRQAAP